MIRRATATLLLVSMAGCSTIQPVASPSTFISSKQPDLIWVTNEWNEIVPLGHPRVSGDSVVGQWIGLGDEVRIPLSRARSVEAKQFHGTRTAILAVSLAAISSVLVYFIAAGDGVPVLCDNPEPGGETREPCGATRGPDGN